MPYVEENCLLAVVFWLAGEHALAAIFLAGFFTILLIVLRCNPLLYSALRYYTLFHATYINQSQLGNKLRACMHTLS